MHLGNLAAKCLAHTEGERLYVLGDVVRVLIDAKETAGQFSVVDVLTEPGGGTPPHVHTREDEAFYVIDGTVALTVGGTAHTLHAHDFAFGPRGIAHHYRNVGAGPSRMIVMITPGGFEDFFRACSDRIGHRMPPDLELLNELAEEAGLRLLMEGQA